MAEIIIIGIHGLLNKPPKETLGKWWSDSINEGLYRNNHIASYPSFKLAYWSDVRNNKPITLENLDERYEKAKGDNPLEKYHYDVKDKIRIVSHKWGGRMIDKGKELFDFPQVNKLIGIKFDDLSDYYENEDIKNRIRLKLSTLLKEQKDKKIILIAHSMGSIVAYDVLRLLEDSEDLQIASFITIGSPIGLPIVAKNIKKEFADIRTPKNVKEWTNFSDPDDKVALDCSLSDEYESYNGVKVKDVLIHNTYVNHEGKVNQHKSYGYLRAPEVSDCIEKFLL